MLRGDWFKRYSIILIGIVLAALLIIGAAYVIKWGLERQIEYERYADEHRKEYTNNTYSPERQRCFRLAAGLQHDCITKARNEATAYNNDQQDLVAQRVTALWTKLMGGAAIVGIMLSAIGVVLIWTTFNAAKEGNAIAREIGIAETRAYLTTSGGSYRIEPDMIFLQPMLKNTGKSPAKRITIKSQIRLILASRTKDNQGGQWESVEFNGVCDDIAGGDETLGYAYLSSKDISAERVQKIHSTGRAYLEGTVSWFDVFSKQQSISFALVCKNASYVDVEGQRVLYGKLRPVMNKDYQTTDGDR
jgi:hypothetical protein